MSKKIKNIRKEKQLLQKEIEVYIVHCEVSSYQNGGKEIYTYLCKNEKIAEEKAENCHIPWCEYENEDDHTYENCKNKDVSIWIDRSIIEVDKDVMMSLRYQV
jgi:hypothetical protein